MTKRTLTTYFDRYYDVAGARARTLCFVNAVLTAYDRDAAEDFAPAPRFCPQTGPAARLLCRSEGGPLPIRWWGDVFCTAYDAEEAPEEAASKLEKALFTAHNVVIRAFGGARLDARYHNTLCRRRRAASRRRPGEQAEDEAPGCEAPGFTWTSLFPQTERQPPTPPYAKVFFDAHNDGCYPDLLPETDPAKRARAGEQPLTARQKVAKRKEADARAALHRKSIADQKAAEKRAQKASEGRVAGLDPNQGSLF